MTQQSDIINDDKFISVLDHGFVGIVEVSGSDTAICQAARISYGKGTKTAREDRGLIRYLMRNLHTSPFEMTSIKLHIKAPIFVLRQLFRHRTHCLAGDVKLQFDLPSGKSVNRDWPRVYPLTVKEVYERFTKYDGIVPCAIKQARLREMQLRCCDEVNHRLIYTHIVDIWETGVKPILNVAFPNGDMLRATKDHLCYTDQGWLKLSDALDSKASFARFGNPKGFVSEESVFSPVELENEEWRSLSDCEEFAKYIVFERPLTVTDGGEEMTYDLAVDGPYHNFSAANTIVHNSANEYSGRYSIMSDEFYLPSVDALAAQSTSNRQGRGAEISEQSKEGVQWLMNASYDHAHQIYRTLLALDAEPGDDIYEARSGENPLLDPAFPGVARELARIVLPVANYSELYWQQSLHNMFHLIKLRADAHAQQEIRAYAEAIYDLIQPYFPESCAAFEDYVNQATSLSRMETALVKDMLVEGPAWIKEQIDRDGLDQFAATRDMSAREMKDFLIRFEIS